MAADLAQDRREGSQSRLVLVVDDDEAVCNSLVLVFEANDYDVDRAYSAEDALSLPSGRAPDLAVIDVMLRKMNGVELARHFLRRDSNCRVLLFSGHPQSGEIVAGLTREGHKFNFVGKPVHPKYLIEWARSGTVPGVQ